MNKKMKKDLIVVTSVLVTTIATVLIGYFAITNTLQLWQTFLQYIAEGQNVTMGLLVVAIWQNVGLQLVTPALAVYGCFVLANFILGQADLSRVRVKSFQFGVFTLMLGSLMLIFPTPQNVSLTVMLFVIPGLLATFLSM
ncbi:MAG: hypothetical protein ACRCZC_07850, partial [Culicoidibacterales bacterium]